MAIELTDLDGAAGGYSSGRVTGFIETDGTFGRLSAGNIRSFNLLGTVDGAGSVLIASSAGGGVTIPDASSSWDLGLEASATGLFYDFGSRSLAFFFPAFPSCIIYFQSNVNSCSGSTVGSPPGGIGVNIINPQQANLFLGQSFQRFSGTQQIGSVAVVPLPATGLLLLGPLVLGALAGALGRRRGRARASREREPAQA